MQETPKETDQEKGDEVLRRMLNPPIGQALATDSFKQHVSAFTV